MCALVLTVWSLIGSERARAQAPVFRSPDSVELRICYNGTSSDTTKVLDTLLGVNCGAGDSVTFSFIGSSGTGLTFTTFSPGPVHASTGHLGVGLDVRPSITVRSTLNSVNSTRYLQFKVTNGAGVSDTLVVVVKEFIPIALPAITGLFDQVHLNDSIDFSNSVSGGAWSVQSGTRVAFSTTVNGRLNYGSGPFGNDSIVYSISNACFITTNVTTPITFLNSVPPTFSTTSPTITAADTMWAIPGTMITLTGSNFNTTAANNIVSFGGVRATVTSASSSILTVTVPVGARFDNISVTDSATQRTGYLRHPFTPSWNTCAYVPSTYIRMTTYDSIILRGGIGAGVSGAKPYSVELGDLDGDGKTDMVVVGSQNQSYVYVYRNISTGGTVNASSFGTALEIRTTPTGSDSISFINAKIADMDGDGKPEILAISPLSSRLYVFRNTSISGNISFATPVFVGFTPSGTIDTSNPPAVLPSEIAVGDFNKDGRTDVAVCATGARRGSYGLSFSWPGSFWVVQNNYKKRADTALHISTSDFRAQRVFVYDTMVSSPISICAGDLSGDGKAEILISDHYKRDFKIFQNTSSGSNITFNTGLTPVSTAVDTLTPGVTGITAKGGYPNQIRCADFNRDGIQEIVVAVSDSDLLTVPANRYNYVAVYNNGAYPGFGYSLFTRCKTGCGPVGIAVGDLNGDHFADMAVSNSCGGSVSIIKNTSSGGALSFAAVAAGDTVIIERRVTGLAGTTGINGGVVSVAIGDIDGNTVNDFVAVSREANLISIVGNHPVPIIGTIISVDTLCLGSSRTAHCSRANCTSGSGAWTVSGGGSRLSATAGGTGMADTSATITALAVGVDTVFYTVTSNFEKSTVMKIFTVVDTAHAGVITGPASVCLNSSITLNNATGALGTWSTSAAATASITTTASTTPAGILGVSVGTATISYVAVSVTGFCPTVTATKLITVNPLPNAGTISGNAAPCVSSSNTYTPSVGGGTWSVTSTLLASISSGGTLMTGTATGPNTILYVVTTPTCGNDTARYAINIINTVLPGITGSRTLCVGSDTTLSDAVTGGTWVSGSTAIASVDPSTGVVFGVSAGSAVITYSVAFCGSASDTFTITILPLPNAGTLTGTSPLCVGASATYTSSGSTGGTWTTSASSIASVNSTSGSVNGVASGSATITYTHTNTCGTVFATIPVNVTPSPNAGTISGTSPLCVGATATYTSTGDAGGAWSSSALAVASVNSTTGEVTALSAGSATISYSATTSCGTDVATRLVTVNPLPNAGTVSGTSPLCVGASATYTSTGTSGGTWTTSASSIASVNATSGSVIAVATGTATITYTHTNSCGTVTARASVTVSPVPNSGTLSGTTPLCVAASATYTTSGDAGGTWTSTATGIASVNSSTGDVTGVSAGSATISYSVTNSCGTTVATRAVTISPLPNAGSVSGTSPLCVGSSATYTSTGTSGGTWTTSAGSIASVNATSGSVNGVATGTATITYTHTNSCGTATATASVTVSPVPNAGTISGTTPLCVAASATFTSGGDAGGVWSSSATGVASVDAATGTVTGVTAGTVTISYTVTACGSATATTSVTISPLPNAGTISGPAALCSDNTATYTSSGDAASHVWSVSTGAGSGFLSIDPATGFATATHTPGAPFGRTSFVTYKTTNSCGTDSTTYTVNIRTKPNLSAIAGPNPVCAGSTATYNVTTATTGGGGGFQWASSNASIASISSARTGTSVSVVFDTFYTTTAVILTDTARNVCGDSIVRDSIVINPLPKIDSITGPDTVCAGTVASYVARGILDSTGTWAATGSVAYRFQHRDTLDVDVVSGGVGSISYTLVSSLGCGTITRSKSVRAIIAPDAGPDRSYTKLVCPGATIMDTADAINNPDVWVSADTMIALTTTGSTIATITGRSPGTVIIYNIHTNRCGSDTANFPVQVQAPAPNAGTIVGLDSACVGVPFVFTDSTYDVTYGPGVWTLGTGSGSIVSLSSLRDSTVIVTGTSAGTATVRFTLSNSCGSTVATKDVKINAYPRFTAQNPSVCDSILLNYTPIYDSTGPGSLFTWSRAAVVGISNLADTGTGAFSVYLDDTTNRTVTVPYNVKVIKHGCVTNGTETVTVKPTPYLTSTKDVTVCSGSPFIYLDSFNVTGTTTAWTRPATINHLTTAGAASGTGRISDMFTSDTLGPVKFQYTYNLNAAGCVSTAKVNVSVNPRPTFPAITTRPNTTNLCTGTMFVNFGTNVTPPSGVNYTWTASNAEVWATGNTRQYCLVNFTKPGTSYVYLLATLTGYNCPAKDSFGIIVNNSVSDTPRVIYFNGDFVCTSNVEESYQWGYDDHNTLDSTELRYETNQNYTNITPDFNGKYYWVITTKGGCMQKSYYKVPTGVNTITGNMGEVKIYPNPASQYLNVEILNTSGGSFSLEVTNMMGQSVSSTKMNGYQGTVDVADLASGIYFIDCYRDGVKFATQKFVKN